MGIFDRYLGYNEPRKRKRANPKKGVYGTGKSQFHYGPGGKPVFHTLSGAKRKAKDIFGVKKVKGGYVLVDKKR